MGFEKPMPFKNEEGQVNDPEIAHKMANREKDMREKGLYGEQYDQDEIDQNTDALGKIEHRSQEAAYENSEIKKLAEKLKKEFSEEELTLLRKRWMSIRNLTI